LTAFGARPEVQVTAVRRPVRNAVSLFVFPYIIISLLKK
jgi:hypothetical protein